MDETSWVIELADKAPGYLIIGFFVYKIVMEVVKGWREKKLKKEGVIPANGKRECIGDFGVVFAGINDLKKAQKEIKEHFIKELGDLMISNDRNMEKLNKAVQEHIDSQTTAIVARHEKGNGILERMLGKLDTLCQFLASR